MTDLNSGLQFDFTYAPGTTSQQMLAFEAAGELWSNYISDNMTVNIHIEMTSVLPDNVIGGALPAMEMDVEYEDFREAYEDDITSGYDRQYFDSLSLNTEGGKEQFEALIDFGSTEVTESSETIDLTRANAKALGLVKKNDKDLDGYILMNDLSNSPVDWRYEVGNSVSDARLDYYSVALHEIGHVLGFVSGLDKYDPVKFDNWGEAMQIYGKWSNFEKSLINIVDTATPLDMFRYSQSSLNISNNHNIIDLSVGSESYFGAGELKYQFATGKDTLVNGDGFQASHWKERDQAGQISHIGIMDPLMRTGSARRATDRDLRAMDALGYDLSALGESVVSHSDSFNQRAELMSPKAELETKGIDHINKSIRSNSKAAKRMPDNWMSDAEFIEEYLTEDRSRDAEKMAKKNLVYEGRKSRSGSSRNYSRQEGFWQEAYFSEFSWQEFNLESSGVSEALPTAIVVEHSFSSPDRVNIGILGNSKPTEATSDRNISSIDGTSTNLLTLSDGETIDTVATNFKTELTSQSSLYRQELAELELFMPLS